MILFPSRSTLAQLSGIPLDAGAVSILHTATEYRLELLRQIGQARQCIYLCSLYLQHDDAGAEILTALHAAKAARPGLDIRVLVDWHRAQRGLIGAGKESGNAAWYQQQTSLHASVVPIYGVPVQTRELFGVLHLKGFVIDDGVIYSGASLNNVYLQKHDKYRFDRYLLIQNSSLANSMVQYIQHHLLSSSAVHRLDMPDVVPTRSIRREIRSFRENLKRARYTLPASSAEDHADTYPAGLTVTPLVGVGKNNPLNRAICQLLAAARQQITICTPYFNFPLAVTREINRALNRGVKIDIIVGDKTANDFFIPPDQAFKVIAALPYLYESNLRRFAKTHQGQLSSGQLELHCWSDGDNTFHLKGLWIDQNYMLMTGNNINPRAFRLDLENALLLHDPQHVLAQQRQAELDGIYRHTKQVRHYTALEKLSDYPAPVRKLLSRLSRVGLDRLAYRVL